MSGFAGTTVGRWTILAALTFLPAALAAQQASIHGIVTASATGVPLEGVTVALQSEGRERHGTVTDRNGFYQIGGIEAGAYSLRATALGFVAHEESITFARGDQRSVTIGLDADVVLLDAIVVAGETGPTVRDLGRQRVTPADLRRVPVPAGSGDLASYLQTLPGVTTTGDRGGQLFVRGGGPASNEVLVDGIPIYQPFHILGFFSVFPEDLVSSVDFYAGGFGARYNGRTSSVLDVGLRDGNPNRLKAMGSVSPFLAEAVVEGPAGPGLSWIASIRRSLVEETSGALMGTTQPIGFESRLLKVTATAGDNLRCSALALHTSDFGRLDPEETVSHIAWKNLLVGGRCVTQLQNFMRLLEVNFSYSSAQNAAVSRGSSNLTSSVDRTQHDAHLTSMVGSIPVYAGYHLYAEFLDYDLSELYAVDRNEDMVFGASAYLEAAIPAGSRAEVRPGVVVTGSPRLGVEPRLRASWEPFGGGGKLQGALGLYRQDVVGISDMRDVGSVFTAWMRTPDDLPIEAVHAILGWQQSLPGGARWSVEGYYKRLKDIPVPLWQAVAAFTTHLGRADGKSYGADARLEYTIPHFYGLLGYGLGWTEYEVSQAEFMRWFGDPVQRFHPPHDRRHQLNALINLDLAGFTASARWQLGSGLPFTQPLGFDEAFDFARDLYDVSSAIGTTRLVLDRPFTGRLPVTHRLDLSLERGFDLPFGRLSAQVGAINGYDRRNMFYYDLFTGRRVDQLPFAPYASLTLRTR